MSISTQLAFGAITGKTIMPAFMIVMGWQSIYFTSVNDVFWNLRAIYYFQYIRVF